MNHLVRELPTANNSKQSVLLLDSEAIVRSGIKALINSFEGFEVIAESNCVDEALSLTEKLRPNIAVVEVSLPSRCGIDFILEVKRKKLSTVIAVLSRLEDYEAANNSLVAGAKAFIPKSGEPRELEKALQTIALTKDSYVPKRYEDKTQYLPKKRKASASKAVTGPLDCLSKREREVFYLLADGLQNTAIAKKLFISPRTVETHRARIVRKLGVNSNGELIRFAIKHGLTVV